MRLKRLLLALALLAAPAFGQANRVTLPQGSALPPCTTGRLGWIYQIADATDYDDCSTFGATGDSRKLSVCVCRWTAGASALEWEALAQGSGGGGGSTFADNVFRVQDNGDATKQIAFEASGITTGTTRTITVPNSSGTLALTTSNVATATALAANGTNCSSGSYARGVDASGNAENCTVAGTGTLDGSTGSTDKAMLIANGTGGATVQASANVFQDSSNNLVIGDSSGARELWFSTVSTAPVIRRNGAALRVVGNEGTETEIQVGAFRATDANATSPMQSISVANNKTVCFSDGVDFAQCLAKGAAAGLRITDGSTGVGSAQFSRPVEANTAGSGAPNVLDPTESAGVLTNEGASAQNYHTLPGAEAGITYTFVVADADGLRITAAAGDVIHLGGLGAVGVDLTSSAGGECHSTTIANAVTLTAVNATDWFATGVVGIGWTCS